METRKQELEGLLNHHNQAYWAGRPEISDAEYDKLVEELRSIDPSSSLCDFLGTPIVSSSGKVEHKEPMLSLDKAYNTDDYMDWVNRSCRSDDETVIVMPKYDGISADWDGYVLSTRGDGHIGENITDKTSLIMMMTIDEHTGEWVGRPITECTNHVRGEIVMLDQDFDNVKDQFKNSRNAVAGALGAIYSVEWAMRMRNMGFRMVFIPHDEFNIVAKASSVAAKIDDIIELCKSAIPVPMDGIVIRIKDTEYGNKLGATSHHPRHSIAYKFANEEATTKLIGVEWSVGLNKVTPVALLEPVELAGVTVSRASLHNIKYVQDMDLQIGDTVVVERAGSVIPNVISRQPGEIRTAIECTKCPICGASLEFDGTVYICNNNDCSGRLVTQITTAAATLGIDDLAHKTVEKLITQLGVRHVGDLFKLTKEQILTVDGFADRSAERLVDNISKASKTKDYLVLAAMNIPGIGVETAKSIVSKYSINELPFVTADAVSSIDGMGTVRSTDLVYWMTTNRELFFRMIDSVTFKDSKDDPTVTNKPVIVFTGAMPKPRDYYKQLAEQNGYIFKDAITKATSVLVVAEEGHKSTKVTKAEKNGCKIITLDQFLSEIETM